VGDELTGGQETIGLRVPGHPVALELLREFGGGIAAPSANRFGRISPTSRSTCSKIWGPDVDLILDGGPCEIGIESTIVDVSRGRPVLLRPGRIRAEDIAEAHRRRSGAARRGSPARLRHARVSLRSTATAAPRRVL